MTGGPQAGNRDNRGPERPARSARCSAAAWITPATGLQPGQAEKRDQKQRLRETEPASMTTRITFRSQRGLRNGGRQARSCAGLARSGLDCAPAGQPDQKAPPCKALPLRRFAPFKLGSKLGLHPAGFRRYWQGTPS